MIPIDTVTIEVFGLKFNRNLKSDPHLNEMILAVASLAGVAQCLRAHLPANLVADVVRALLVGKVGYGIAAAFFPCLHNDDPRPTLSSTLQVKVNDVARAICGSCKADHLQCDLPSQSYRPSFSEPPHCQVRGHRGVEIPRAFFQGQCQPIDFSFWPPNFL